MVAGATPVPLVGTPRRYDTILLSLGFLGADSATRCKQLFSEVSPGNLAGGWGREGRQPLRAEKSAGATSGHSRRSFWNAAWRSFLSASPSGDTRTFSTVLQSERITSESSDLSTSLHTTFVLSPDCSLSCQHISLTFTSLPQTQLFHKDR